jgi:transcription elongation factor Elf1
VPSPDDQAERPGAAKAQSAASLTCDFCGAAVPHVRRVALDRDYDRLQQPHPVRFACPACSEEKERSRGKSSAQSGRA